MKLNLITFLLVSFIAITLDAEIIGVPGEQPSIQAGIDAAQNGDTVLVEQGVYYESINFKGKEILVTSNYLFDGQESTISNTIIDGSQLDNADSASVVYFISGENLSSVLSGFTIQNGKGTYPDVNSMRSGGGIYCVNSDARIEHSRIIENNIALENSGYGGGLFCYNAILETEDCNFYNNSAVRGGGLYTENSKLICNNTYFDSNQAETNGGALYFFNSLATGSRYINISECSFVNNNASESAGGLLVRNQEEEGLMTELKIENSVFSNNSANQRCGIYIYGEGVKFDIINTVFRENEANKYAAAASISYSSYGNFHNCLFEGNMAAIDGGTFNSGGASVWSGANVGFTNCVFYGNTASFGAGLTVGGGGKSVLNNCIFWSNTNDQISLTSYNQDGGELWVNYCDIENGLANVDVSPESLLNAGEGNISNDPLFVSEGDSPFSLLDGSPAIDAGTPDTNGLELPLVDMANNVRIWDGNGDGTAIIDMGIFEFNSHPIGIDELQDDSGSEMSLVVYPNPCKSEINIRYSLKNLSDVKITFRNITGQTIKTINKTVEGQQTETLNIENLPKGIYFCTLSGNGFSKTVTVIK